MVGGKLYTFPFKKRTALKRYIVSLVNLKKLYNVYLNTIRLLYIQPLTIKLGEYFCNVHADEMLTKVT